MTSVQLQHFSMRIGGADVDSGRTMSIVDPSTGAIRSRAEFATIIRDDTARWGKAVAATGFKAD